MISTAATRGQRVDRLQLEIHPNRDALGAAAARAVHHHLSRVIAARGVARVVFACAPSQDAFLAALRATPALPWEHVTAFHMDEYVGIDGDHPQSFRHYLRTHLLDHVPIGQFHPLAADGPDLAAVCARYAALLDAEPVDLICLGIGENGHIAFNDPDAADFNDPATVKRVSLDHRCRRQQVNDGCFATVADVPTHALTLTVPVFRRARRLSIHVSGARKAAAVRAALRGAVTPLCPASILRLHPAATLYLDADSAAGL